MESGTWYDITPGVLSIKAIATCCSRGESDISPVRDSVYVAQYFCS